jgi:hypothetical protein
MTAGAKCGTGYTAVSCDCDTKMSPAFKPVSISFTGRNAVTNPLLNTNLGIAATNGIRVVRNALLSKDSTDKNLCACAAVYTAVHSGPETAGDDDESEPREAEVKPPRKRRDAGDAVGDGHGSGSRKHQQKGSSEKEREDEDRREEPPAKRYLPEWHMPRCVPV